MDESQLRAEVLRYYYEFYRANPGDGQWSHYAVHDINRWLKESGNDASLSEVDVARGIKYLSEKGLLRIRQTQGYISGEPTALQTEITGRGIDVFEEPDNFPGLLPMQVVRQINVFHGAANIVHGDQIGTIVQGDQQSIGGDNVGTMVQGNVCGTLAESFPAAQLREQLVGKPEAIAVVDRLAGELDQEKPSPGKVLTWIEALKAYANIADVGRILGGWLADPEVQQHIHGLTKGLWH